MHSKLLSSFVKLIEFIYKSFSFYEEFRFILYIYCNFIPLLTVIEDIYENYDYIGKDNFEKF